MSNNKGDGVMQQIQNSEFKPTDKPLFDYLTDIVKSDSSNETIQFTKGWCGQESHDKWITEMLDMGFSQQQAESYFTPNPEIFGGSGWNFDFTQDI